MNSEDQYEVSVSNYFEVEAALEAERREHEADEAQCRGGFTCEAPAHAGVAMFEAVAFGYVEV